jgi:oligoribonuclease (3'-5' exoribonuclease)
MKAKHASRDRIVWLDLELYSLNDHRVLECAVILTTCNALTEIARRNWVIYTSQEDINAFVLGGEAGDFHKKHSRQNGLLRECLQSPTGYDQWKSELLVFLKTHCARGCRLAGFSPHVDRDVLRTQAPLVYSFLYHQIIDVTSLDIIQWGLPTLERDARLERDRGSFDGNHRAMSDVEAAIKKIKWYQAWLREKTTNAFANLLLED